VKAVGDTPAEAAFEAAKQIRKIKSGEVVLVGAGPGNPDFITVAGCKALAKADVVVYDKLVSHELLRYAPTTSKKIFVGKQCGHHSASQDEINSILAREAIINKYVVRLKGGDPYVFGRGGEEREYLESRGIKVSVIPGVTSAIAGPAAVGIPVTHRGKARAFAVITAHGAGGGADELDYDSLARFEGTLIFLMGFSEIDIIAKRLVEVGKSASLAAGVVCSATTSEEKFVTGTLGDIAAKVVDAKLSPPGIFVVGETVEMHKENFLPLSGLKIFVPVVGGGMADNVVRQLCALGADVRKAEVGKIISNHEVLPEKDEWHKFTWLAFTSAVAVRMFSPDDVRAVRKAKVKVAAIGPATALVAGEAGFEVSFMPKGGTGEDFASEFSEILSSDESVFHPVSAAAKSPLSKIADKCSYVSAAVYKNAACEKVEDDVVGDADMVVFTCPSSVARTPLRKDCCAVVIGETTRKSALLAGWENVIVASSPSVQGIVDALLLNFLTKKQREVK
jgi:uroporphyrinogen III methyltransferase/synthase